MLLYLVQPDDALARELREECTELGHSVVRVRDASADAVVVPRPGELPGEFKVVLVTV